MTTDRLDYRELLDFERRTPRTLHPRLRAQEIEEQFGVGPDRYHAELDRVLDDPRALEYAPDIVPRLLRLREARRGLREARRYPAEPPPAQPAPIRQQTLDLVDPKQGRRTGPVGATGQVMLTKTGPGRGGRDVWDDSIRTGAPLGRVFKRRHQSSRMNATRDRWFFACADTAVHDEEDRADQADHGYETRRKAAEALAWHWLGPKHLNAPDIVPRLLRIREALRGADS